MQKIYPNDSIVLYDIAEKEFVKNITFEILGTPILLNNFQNLKNKINKEFDNVGYKIDW